jgi:hypothetical protein
MANIYVMQENYVMKLCKKKIILHYEKISRREAQAFPP